MHMKIKEVEKLLQINSQTIRYYEKLDFLKPKRDENGYRNYTQEDVQILRKIHFLRDLDIPLEMIQTILLNPDQFQNILNKHLKFLQAKIENLEEVQQKCFHLNQKNIPLLDAIIDGEFQNQPAHSHDEIKSIIHKASEFIKPYPVVTLGRKTTPFQFLKEIIFIFISTTLITMSFLLYFINTHTMTHIHWGLYLLSVILLTIIFIFILFHEKYYEFGIIDFYIFDSYKMKAKSIKAVLENTTHEIARHYLYKDICDVKIHVEKKIGGIGFGPVTYYNIIYQFHMRDGNHFQINSSLYQETSQDRKSVYEILDYHHVKIIDEQNLKQFFLQKNLSIYEYLEKRCT